MPKIWNNSTRVITLAGLVTLGPRENSVVDTLWDSLWKGADGKPGPADTPATRALFESQDGHPPVLEDKGGTVTEADLAPPGTTPAAPSSDDLSGLKVEDAKARVAGMDDADALKRLKRAEARVTVKDFIQARIDELKAK